MRYIQISEDFQQSEFSSILNDPTIQMGFECEIVLPNYFDPTTVASVEALSWTKVPKLFRFSSKTASDGFELKYHEWLEDYHNLNSDVIGDEYIPDFLEYSEDHQIVKSGLKLDVLNKFGFEPIHGWAKREDGVVFTSPVEHKENVTKTLADKLGDDLGVPTKNFDTYHGGGRGNLNTAKQDGFWYVEPDESISAGIEDATAEVVSPVYPLGEALQRLSDFFQWMKTNGYKTSDKTGLHINLSIKGKTNDDYDYLKMIVMFDERFVADLFNRLDNKFALQMKTRLSIFLNPTGVMSPGQSSFKQGTGDAAPGVERTLKAISRLGSEGLVKRFDKYYSINNRGNGVFEFRTMGGAGYENRFQDIRKQVVRMAYALRLGSDSEKDRNAYVKKLYQLFNQGKFSAPIPETPYGLESFAPFFKSSAKLISSLNLDLNSPENVVYAIIITINGMGDKQRKELYSFVKKMKIYDKVLAKFSPTEEYSKDRFMSVMGTLPPVDLDNLDAMLNDLDKKK